VEEVKLLEQMMSALTTVAAVLVETGAVLLVTLVAVEMVEQVAKVAMVEMDFLEEHTRRVELVAVAV
jgi:hypothetical protein